MKRQFDESCSQIIGMMMRKLEDLDDQNTLLRNAVNRLQQEKEHFQVLNEYQLDIA